MIPTLQLGQFGRRLMLGNESSIWDVSQTSGGLSATGNSLSDNGGSFNARAYGNTPRNSGKRYFEIYNNNGTDTGSNGMPKIGVSKVNSGTDNQQLYMNGAYNYCEIDAVSNLGRVYSGYDVIATLGSSFAPTDGATIMVAMDIDTGKLWFGKNGTFSGDPAAGTGQAHTMTASVNYYPSYSYFISSGAFSGVLLKTVDAQFTYSPPSGFVAWN